MRDIPQAANAYPSRSPLTALSLLTDILHEPSPTTRIALQQGLQHHSKPKRSSLGRFTLCNFQGYCADFLYSLVASAQEGKPL